VPTDWTPAELLFLLGVALVLAFLAAGETLELRRARRLVPNNRLVEKGHATNL
jgi:hypothetical protein